MRSQVWMNTVRPFNRCLVASLQLLLLLVCLKMTLSLSSVPKTNEENKNNDPIQDAIDKSRYHLQHFTSPDAPYAFPKTRYRLAVMLESKLDDKPQQQSQSTDEDNDNEISLLLLLKEICCLYQEAASNTTTPLDASQRISAYCNAADLLIQYDYHHANDGGATIITEPCNTAGLSMDAESILQRAFDVKASSSSSSSGEGEDLAPYYAMAFEILVRWYLREASLATAQQAELKKRYLEKALSLCDDCSKLCPNEPIVPEKRGAVLRLYHGISSHNKGAGSDGGAFILSQDATSKNNNNAAATQEVYAAYQTAAEISHRAAMATIAQFGGMNNQKQKQKVENHPYGSLPKLTKTVKQSLEKTLLENDNHVSGYVSDIWNRLLGHIVLAASSARELIISSDDDSKNTQQKQKIQEDHWKYGLDILTQLVDNNDDNGGHAIISIPPESQADFYVNVGIHYKKLSSTTDKTTNNNNNYMKLATKYFRKALKVHPGDGHALVQLASMEDYDSTNHVVKLDDSYVSGLFDGYSQTFEQSLVEDLQYIGHELVSNALFQQGSGDGGNDWLFGSENDVVTEQHPRTITIVDLGCGTGLLGELLRRRLEEALHPNQESACSNQDESIRILGVDLSSRMVDISRMRTITSKEDGSPIPVYDDVQVSDGVAFLQQNIEQDGTVCAITASDVFIYIGALEGVFQECARALKVGGFLAFTVELANTKKKGTKNSDDGVQLLKSGRFGHSRAYIERLGEEFGLQLQVWDEAVLRTQGGSDVPGAVVTMQRMP